MTNKIITSRTLQNAIHRLSQPFSTEPTTDTLLKPEWTDEQLEEAYAQLSPLYGKRCILEYQQREEQRTKEGFLKPEFTSIGFTHYMAGGRPSLTLFSIEDFVIVEREPLLRIKADVSCWNDFPYYGLDASINRIKLYSLGIRKPK